MSKLIVIITITALITAFSPSTFADDDSRFFAHLYNCALFGTVAGLIIGIAVAQGSITTFKMTSIGLYGGIALGLTTKVSPDKSTYEQNPSTDLSPKTPTYVFTFHY